MKIRKKGRKPFALFLGLMLLLLPFAFSLPTLAEDNSPAADVIPDSLKNAPPPDGSQLWYCHR